MADAIAPGYKESSQSPWLTSDIGILLVTDAYVYSATHEFVGDVSASEVVDSGYSRETITTGKTIDSADAGVNRILNATVSSWDFGPMAGARTVAGAWLFLVTGSDPTSRLVAFYDLGSIAVAAGEIFRLTKNASGFVKAT